MNLIIGVRVSFPENVKYELETYFSFDYKSDLCIRWDSGIYKKVNENLYECIDVPFFPGKGEYEVDMIEYMESKGF